MTCVVGAQAGGSGNVQLTGHRPVLIASVNHNHEDVMARRTFRRSGFKVTSVAAVNVFNKAHLGGVD